MNLAEVVKEMLRDPRAEVLDDFLDASINVTTEATRVDLDILTAFALMRPEDPANPWNAAAKYEELGHLEAAASWYVQAVQAIKHDEEVGASVATWDDPDWGEAAAHNAARALVSAGLVISASVLASRIEGGDRDEVVRLILEALGDSA